MSEFEYEIDDSEVTITNYTGAGGDVVVPDTIDGFPVTCIGDNAFCYCAGLTSITLPEGCTTIGYYAFSRCTSLTSITLPNSITTISVGAFQACTSLTSITLPNSITTIEERAFARCTVLTSITLPNSLITIGVRAFARCTSLTSITLPNSITTIGRWAFQDCDADITIRRDTEQKKLHAIYALVQANRNYTAPEAFELVCEKIMELKEDAK